MLQDRANHFLSTLSQPDIGPLQGIAAQRCRAEENDQGALDCLTGHLRAVRSVPDAALVRPADLKSVWAHAAEVLGSQVAGLAEVERAYDKNQCSILIVKQSEAGGETCNEIVGVLATLHLSCTGNSAILDGTFSPKSINTHWLVGTSDVPVASYVWAIAAKGTVARRRIVLLGRRLSLTFSQIDQYARPVTPAGRRILQLLGFRRRQPDIPGSLWVRSAIL